MRSFVRFGLAALAFAGIVGTVAPPSARAAEAATSPLLPLHVSGRELVAGDKPVRLRGIDWGWWHLSGTQYTEDDMRRQAAWGANVARLVFSYYDLQNPDGSFTEEGFRKFDDVIRWGKKYGVYIILDMHTVPGGQSRAAYCAGGKNLVWTDPTYRKRYLALWQEIARRYRDRPEVAAYELMNEPETGQKEPDRLMEMQRSVIAAIRPIDPNKVIVVCGDHSSGANSMVDALKVSDPNILYTFHFYNGSTSWIRNLKDGKGIGIRGTQDWTHLEETFTPPADASEMAVMLRSSANTGTAWFDDVRLEDTTSGQTLVMQDFNTNTQTFAPERGPKECTAYDPAIGHDHAGSLRVQNTPEYNGWSGHRMTLQPGHSYRLSAWVKLDHATGDTYLTVAFYHSFIDPKALQVAMAMPIDFAKKYNVPIWVGEFGYEAWTPPAGSQAQWVRTCIDLFEQAGFDWTYWNYRESTGPDSMALHAEHKDGSDYPINESLLDALRAGWRHNTHH